jgi:general secretion pathway protein G
MIVGHLDPTDDGEARVRMSFRGKRSARKAARDIKEALNDEDSPVRGIFRIERSDEEVTIAGDFRRGLIARLFDLATVTTTRRGPARPFRPPTSPPFPGRPGPAFREVPLDRLRRRDASATPKMFPSVFTSRSRQAKITAARADLSMLEVMLETFEVDCARYPTTEEGLQALIQRPPDLPDWKGPYLKRGVPRDPWRNPYVYRFPGLHNNDYDLYSFGPDGRPGGGDDIDNWSDR